MFAALFHLAAREAADNCTHTDSSAGSQLYNLSTFSWWVCLLLAAFCVLLSALASGANMGVMSLSLLELRLLTEVTRGRVEDDPLKDPAASNADAEALEAAKCARRVLPLVRRKHLVLVTLLLTTALADEVLPLCINAIAPTWVAVVASVFFMLFFTEIIPTAIFTDTRVNLRLTSALTPFVWFLMFTEGLLTVPIAMALKSLIDRQYGKDTNEDGSPLTLSAGGTKPSFDGKSQQQQQQQRRNSASASDPIGSLLRVVKLKALMRLLIELAPDVSLHHPAPRSAFTSPSGAAPAMLSDFPSTPPMRPTAAPDMSSHRQLPAASISAALLVSKNQLLLAERVLDLPQLRLRDISTPLSHMHLGEKFTSETTVLGMLHLLALWAADRAAWCVHGTAVLRIRRLVQLLTAPGAPFMGQGKHLLELAAGEPPGPEYATAVASVPPLSEDMTLPEALYELQRFASPFGDPHDQLAGIVLLVDTAGAIVGVVDLRHTVRHAILPDAITQLRCPVADKQLRRASTSVRRGGGGVGIAGDSPEADGHRGHTPGRGIDGQGLDDDDLADIGLLMLQPREANAVPWSQRYANTRF
jgi:hypothetical protein